MLYCCINQLSRVGHFLVLNIFLVGVILHDTYLQLTDELGHADI